MPLAPVQRQNEIANSGILPPPEALLSTRVSNQAGWLRTK